MKKIYISMIALALVGFSKFSMAQAVTATFEVDMHNYLNGGGVISPSFGMRVGGTFSTDSVTNTDMGTAMMNWTPSDTASRMQTNGDSVYYIDLQFAGGVVGIGDTLQFKFVNGNWYGTGGCATCTNEDANGDHSLVLAGCSPSAGSEADNRLFAVPVVSGGVWKWCYDSCHACNGALVNGVQVVNPKVAFFSLAPNPAVNKQSTMIYSISGYSPVTISLYNVLGQVVKTFVNTARPSGVYNQPIDLSTVSSGVYFIQLNSGDQTVSKKIVVN